MNRDQLFAWLQYPLPHHLISRLAGHLADCSTPWLKNALIRQFIKTFDVDMREAAHEDPEAYRTFNEFFTRPLKHDARPIGAGVVSPADGLLSQYGAIDNGDLIQAKGHTYSVQSLLGGNRNEAATYARGQFATIYLSPRDYHRVHMPFAGRLVSTRYVPGRIFSVNQATAREVPGLFARNERLVCHFETEAGPMAVVLIGAMIVAGIETVWSGQVTPGAKSPQTTRFDDTITLEAGDELGRFKLGSSVVICLPEGVAFHSDVDTGQMLRMGQSLAVTS
ncbi:archaetidylserine decarboxylase [Larsenimonas sp. GH3-8]|uniref:Phosphatidylserine decarboxylase proenzyme n=1 Tax=Larsenimonas rhizosphaerae TaxID=2944682 RepID=A0AA41ZIA2_9GAMM|nr:archaetidylserine decarboxylase [Larsenimonas rhizosphaerae]MCM2132096.1 archaetidylserine decarboxylase [Larsenimonas rhizosphaerae]MCX2524699.1 archaetidylserine decarboxylase [Larsenimonas rhizosphaerae]